jgi:hypothetical protein
MIARSERLWSLDSPVIENLTPQDVSADAPAVGPALVAEPVVAQGLGVEVVDLVARVVDVDGWTFGTGGDEEALYAYSLVSKLLST